MKRVLLAMPSREGTMHVTVLHGIVQPRPFDVPIIPSTCSVLTLNHNSLLAEALNHDPPVDGVIFLHDDVVPHQAGWIQILVEEAERVRADILSVAIPMRQEQKGKTSIGVGTQDNLFDDVRRLTLKEIHSLPETFGTEILLDQGNVLLANTGCMLLDLRQPWIREMIKDGECFRNMDRIDLVDGKYIARCSSEDTTFTRYAQDYGARLFVTRKVTVDHWDRVALTSATAWGLETDPFYEGKPVPWRES